MNLAAMTTSLAKPLPRLMLTWLVGCAACHAQTHYVYRFAFTPPERVFATGFQAVGNDLNMLHYLGGTVASARDSGFVSVTANYDNVRDMAATSIRYDWAGRTTGYIYRISADSTFYDVSLSVRHFFEQERQAGISGPHRSLMRSIQATLPLESSQRLVATHGIAPGMIQWAVPVSLASGSDMPRLETGVYRDNPNWVGYDDSRISNAAPYSMTWPDAGHAPPSEPCAPSAGAGSAGANCTGDVHAVVVENPGIEGALLRYYSPFDFADCSSSASSQREKRQAGEAACDKLPVINISRMLRVIDIMSAES